MLSHSCELLPVTKQNILSYHLGLMLGHGCELLPVTKQQYLILSLGLAALGHELSLVLCHLGPCITTLPNLRHLGCMELAQIKYYLGYTLTLSPYTES
jgi:hypothetical protein